MRKLYFTIVLVTVFIASLAIATAILTQIWSNPVTVAVSDYVFTLEAPANGTIYDIYVFNGSLMLAGNPVAGQTVELYCDDVATGLTDVTDAEGLFSINWTTSVAGTYTFKVDADV